MSRVPCDETDTFGTVVNTFLASLNNPNVVPSSITVGNSPGNAKELLAGISDCLIIDMGLKHGDIVYVEYQEKSNADKSAIAPVSATVAIDGSIPINMPSLNVSQPLKFNESVVEELLQKEEGFIPRKKSYLCKHGDRGMCEYCSPLPPWDKGYHEENNIKHISFHSHLRKLNEGTNKKGSGSSYIAPLSQPDFRINKHCTNGHEPWPRGICSKCQPSAITLKQQEFRMVDHVEFQKSDIIDNFIDSWRSTGMQRFAYMYGSYEKYDATPLGIKAIVEAIYEPPQHDEQDGLTMEIDQVNSEMEKIDQLATIMGLERIGLIFTDLTDTGKGDGTVFCKRHKDSFFLSSLEIIMAAKNQLLFPNASKYSEQGKFSSKFVTCVVSGNLQSEIDIFSYQVSTDAEALVGATIISGSTHPSMAYINDTTSDRYVPEIFYMKKNEYGLTIKDNAKPAFPVEYLLVTLSHGFIKEDSGATPKFITSGGFPWSNRQAMGLSQDYNELKRYIFQAATNNDFNELHERISNFHFLLYVYSLDILSQEEWKLLVTAATSNQPDGLLLQLISSGGWQTLIMILQESS